MPDPKRTLAFKGIFVLEDRPDKPARVVVPLHQNDANEQTLALGIKLNFDLHANARLRVAADMKDGCCDPLSDL